VLRDSAELGEDDDDVPSVATERSGDVVSQTEELVQNVVAHGDRVRQTAKQLKESVLQDICDVLTSLKQFEAVSLIQERHGVTLSAFSAQGCARWQASFD